MTQEIRFKVSLDDSGVPAGASRTEAGLRGIEKAGRQASSAMAGIGAQGKLTANDLRLLSMQTSDIAVSLGSGQSPFIVLLQQGAQLRDQFGSVRGVFSAYAQVLSVTRVAAGGAAAVLGALGMAAWQGYEQSTALQRGLLASGQAAGVTRGQVDALSRSLATMSGAPIGGVRDAMATLATSGAFVGESLELAGRASIAMARMTGQSADDVAKDLAKMADGVTSYVVGANKQYNFLTIEVYRQIKALEAQGRTQEATNLALRELAATMESRAVPAMGSLERAVERVKAAGSGFWDWLLGIGRADTPENALAAAQAELDKLERRLQDSRNSPVRTAGVSMLERERDAQRQVVANIQEDMRRGQRKAEADAKAAANVRSQIEADRNGKAQAAADAQLQIEAASSQKSLALAQNEADAKRRIFAEQYMQQVLGITAYRDAVEKLERDRAAAETRAAQQELDRARRRPGGDAAAQASRQAAIIQAEIKVAQAAAAAKKLEDEIRQGRFAPEARPVLESAGAAFRRDELAQGQAVQAALDARAAAAKESARGLLAINRELSISLMQDDRARGLAQIAQEEDTMRRRMDLAALSVQERQDAEESLAAWRLMREKQLTDQLLPEWRRSLELWADTQRDMQIRYDDFMAGFVRTGQDAFSQWVQSGKLSASTLVSFIRAEFAKLVYQRFLASYVQQAGNWLFSTLLGAGTAATGAGMPDDVPTRGGRALGGAVPPYSAWTVGERGPETLVMGRNGGVIVPNPGATGQGMQVVLNQTINATGGEDTARLYQLAAMAKQMAMDGIAEARARGDRRYA